MKRCGNILSLGIFGGVALICLAFTRAGAAESKEIGTFKDWSAHMLIEKKAKICYLHGAPDKSTGSYKKRGDSYLQVTHRPGSRIRNEVSVTAGYSYKKRSVVSLAVDGRKFNLFTQGDTAWSGDKSSDDKLVAAMRAGRTMVVRGTSGRGTLTTDTYSLSGLTAAHRAISKACGLK